LNSKLKLFKTEKLVSIIKKLNISLKRKLFRQMTS